MTLKKLAETILALLEHDPDGKLLELPVYAVHSGTGASHDVTCIFVERKTHYDLAGPLCEKVDDTPYIHIDIDH